MACSIPRIHILGADTVCGHLHIHILCPFLSLLNLFNFECPSQVAELNGGQGRGKISRLLHTAGLLREREGQTREGAMATLALWGPHARGQLPELRSSQLDLIKPSLLISCNNSF